MNKSYTKLLSTLVLSVLIIGMLGGLNFMPAKAQTAAISIINPGTDGYPAKWTAGPADTIGTSNFAFHADTTATGDNFFVNLTASDVTGLFGWGAGLIYDTTQLQYVSAWRPSDDVFAYINSIGGTVIVAPIGVEAVDATHNIIKMGVTYIMPDPEWTFTGSGTLFQVQFKIIGTVAAFPPELNTISSTLYFSPDWTAFYYFPSGQEIPTLGTAIFSYTWAFPTTLPDLTITPAVYESATLKLGDDVEFDVYANNVAAGWSIIGFQFALWFNNSMLEATGGTDGTWVQSFVNGGESYVSSVTFDYLGVDPALPPGYNKYMCMAAIVPDPVNGWTAPFISGSGMLFALHFNATYQTISPVEAWTTLEIHDAKAYNIYGQNIAFNFTSNAEYRAPMKILGLAIDEYTQYPAPYGGQGPNNPSDAFAPQAEVVLYATVTYNDDPVQQKLVGFQVVSPTGEFVIYRENYTDANGVATVSFRIPWPCVDPAGRILGLWTETSTVEVAQQVVNDTIPFMVWWPVQVLSVTPKADAYIKDKVGGQMPNMEFTVSYGTYQMQPIPVLLTVEVYDELGFHIGSSTFATTVGSGTYNNPPVFTTYTQDFSIPMPTNAAVGSATVYANAFSDFPVNGGVPYCPEVSNTFWINKA